MSFSVTIKGKPGDVAEKVAAELSMPDGVKQFVLAGVSALQERIGDRDISVSAYGHLHDGTKDNAEASNATITVKPVAA